MYPNAFCHKCYMFCLKYEGGHEKQGPFVQVINRLQIRKERKEESVSSPTCVTWVSVPGMPSPGSFPVPQAPSTLASCLAMLFKQPCGSGSKECQSLWTSVSKGVTLTSSPYSLRYVSFPNRTWKDARLMVRCVPGNF